MKEFIYNLSASVITVFGVGMLTFNAEATITAVATLLSFVGFKYLVDKTATHIGGKLMPTALEWTKYAGVLLSVVMLVVGFYFHSIYCLIFSAVGLIVAVTCGSIAYVQLKKASKE